MIVFSPLRTVLSLAYSPDSRLLMSAGGQHVSLWDRDTATERPVQQDPVGTFCQAVAFSPDGGLLAWLAATPEDRSYELRSCSLHTLRQFDAETFRPYCGRSWGFGSSPVGYVNDKTLLVADGNAISSAVSSVGEPVAVLKGGATDCHMLAVSPDGDVVVVGGRFGVRLLRTADWREANRVKLPGGLTSLKVGAGGRTACVTRAGKLVILRPNGTVEHRDKRMHYRTAAFTPDGRHLFATGLEPFVIGFDAATWVETVRFDWQIGSGEALAIAPDGLTVAVGGFVGHIGVFDLDL